MKTTSLKLTPITRAFAILAPVPEEHLLSGKQICDEQGKVAFGICAFEVFHRVKTSQYSGTINIFIYASIPQVPIGPMVSWQAVYDGYVEARRNGSHPAGVRFRPPTAHQNDTPGWAIYWEVRDLRKIDPFPIQSLKGFDKKTHYVPHFVPEGPLVIECP